MSTSGTTQAARQQQISGSAYALAAFGFWGTIPLYFKAVEHIPVAEVLAHRVFWSLVCVALLLFALRQWSTVLSALRNRRMIMALAASSLLISTNWLIFIWAISNERALEASLGYYITPLVSVLLGRMILGEHLQYLQWAAVMIAALGVLFMLVRLGVLPWVSILLGLCFGGYGLVRKMAAVGALPGLFIETLLIAPVALAYLVYLGVLGEGALGTDTATNLLVIAAGVVTALPLLLYAQAVKRLRLASIGLFQYITPTGQLLIAIFVFGELFTTTHMVTFGCIWLALLLYSASAWRSRMALGPV